jgi:hypothetical protein
MKRKNSVLYLDSNCLLVINSKGKLKTLYTPFRVKCINAVDSIPENSWVIVDKVEQKGPELLYFVQAKAFSFRHFQIQIKF